MTLSFFRLKSKCVVQLRLVNFLTAHWAHISAECSKNWSCTHLDGWTHTPNWITMHFERPSLKPNPIFAWTCKESIMPVKQQWRKSKRSTHKINTPHTKPNRTREKRRKNERKIKPLHSLVIHIITSVAENTLDKTQITTRKLYTYSFIHSFISANVRPRLRHERYECANHKVYARRLDAFAKWLCFGYGFGLGLEHSVRCTMHFLSGIPHNSMR